MTNIKVNDKLINSLANNADYLSKGREIFYNGDINLVKSEKKGNFTTYTYDVDYKGKNKILIRTDKSGSIKGFGCNNDACVDLTGACEHVIGALFYAHGKSVTTKTNHNEDIVKEFLDNISENVNIKKYDYFSNEKLSLIPDFEIDDRMYINLKIRFESDKKVFVIKDISEFLDNVLKSEKVIFGKNNSVYLSERKFADDISSKELLDTLIYEYKINDYFEEYKKNLELSPMLLDKIYDIYENQLFFASSEEKPDIKIKITIDPNKLRFFNVTDEVKFFDGINHSYCLFKGMLYRVSTQFKNFLQSLEKSFNKFQGKYLIFENQDLENFLSQIYPLLCKFDLIDEKSMDYFYNIGCYPLEVKFYLDVEDRKLALQLHFIYSNQTIIYGEENNYEGVRNYEKEYEILSLLEFCGFALNNNKFYIADDTDIFRFYKDKVFLLEKFGEVFITKKVRIQYSPNKNKTNLKVSLKGDLLDIKIINDGFTQEELLEALNAYSTTKKFYRLPSGKFLDYEDEDINETLTFLNVIGDGQLTKNRSLFIKNILNKFSFDFVADDNYSHFINEIQENSDLLTYPPHLDSILRDYQKDGIAFIYKLLEYNFGCILADEMGLGKTIEVIGLLEIMPYTKPVLIVSPTSLIYNWESEFEKFSKMHTLNLIIGPPEVRKETIEGINSGIYITTYDTLKRDIEFYKDKNFQCVILDEAQYIKNPETKVSQSIKELNKITGIALTGTPIENSLTELWSIFDFIMPGYLDDLPTFNNEYSNPIMMDNNDSASTLLKSQISSFILRRLKADVLSELPEKIETVIHAPMKEEQEVIYNSYFKEAVKELFTDDTTNHMAMIGKLVRLRQLACHPNLFLDDYDGGSGKLDTAIELIQDSLKNNNRVLLFSQFTSMLSIIKNELEKQDISYFYLDGQTNAKDRNILCSKFNSGQKEVFLISLKAGGTGLNLTGANIIIHFDPWWNPSIMNQASDRAHRFGQKKVVQVFNLISRGTVEEKIHELQIKKKELIDSVLTNEVKPLTSLSKEELSKIFTE